MVRAEAAEGAAWLQWRKVAREKRMGMRQRRRGEREGQQKNRSEIAQEVVAGIKEKVSVHDGIKEAVQRPAGQSFMRSLDCLQIKLKKRRNTGEKGTRRQHNGMQNKHWRYS